MLRTLKGYRQISFCWELPQFSYLFKILAWERQALVGVLLKIFIIKDNCIRPPYVPEAASGMNGITDN